MVTSEWFHWHGGQMLFTVISQTPFWLGTVVTILTRQHHRAVLHLSVCLKVTAVVGIVFTFIADVLWRIRNVSEHVAIKREFCVPWEFTLVTLEILFLSVSCHVDFHVPFSSGTTCLVVTLVALKNMTYVVFFCQVSFKSKRFCWFKRTHGAFWLAISGCQDSRGRLTH